jgi:hypothetical protein
MLRDTRQLRHTGELLLRLGEISVQPVAGLKLLKGSMGPILGKVAHCKADTVALQTEAGRTLEKGAAPCFL